MRIIRHINSKGQIHHAVLESDGMATNISGDIFNDFEVNREKVRIEKLLAPLVPTQILGVGLNYRRHAEESGAPLPQYVVLFMKGVNTVQNPDDPILLPTFLPSSEVDYEAELAVVIGKRCKNIPRESALEYVLGYTCANDVSARDWQLKKGGSQWCRGKTFDTFTPLGPCLTMAKAIPNPNMLRISSRVSGQIMQDWNTEDMIFDVPAIIAFLSGSTTLLPGTVILTGTPHGVGMAQKPPRWLRPGDTVTVNIENIGSLNNPVQNEIS